MATIPKPAGTMPASETPRRRARNVTRLLRGLVHATLDRLTLPQRDTPPEYYRFPWF